jgi:SmpA / OmlA family
MRFRLRTVFILFTVVAVTFVGVRSCIDWLDPFAGRSFDRKLWHEFNKIDDPNNPRASMVASLQRRHLKLGMTRDQVVNLLGEPDMAKTPEMYEYNLGMWSGFRMDYDGLQIYFDKKGRLSSVQCVQH